MDKIAKLDIYDYINDRVFTKEFISEFEKDKFKRKLRYSKKLAVLHDYGDDYYLD